MAQVVVTIAGRTYRMNCEDGQEPHLHRLAQEIDDRTGVLKQSFGEIGDQRLIVMTTLTVADELDAARRRIEALEAELRAARADIERAQASGIARAADLEDALDNATARIGRLLEVLAPSGA